MEKIDYATMYAVNRKLQYAVRRGLVTKLPCEVCGNERSEGHQSDYSRPLEVKWLCHRHHCELHRGNHLVSDPDSLHLSTNQRRNRNAL